MVQRVIDLVCPGCGSPTNTSQKFCDYCGRQVVISSFNSTAEMPLPLLNKYTKMYGSVVADNPDSVELNTTLALCFLKLRLYDKALPYFEKAMENDFENSESFFYAAVCLLRGKKAFLTPHADLKKAMEYIDAAIMIEPRGIYYYFLAYIKYDFYERKCLNITPGYADEMNNALDNGVSHADVQTLFEFLGVDIPNVLRLE